MLESLAIVALGIIPAMFSILIMRKAETQARERLQTAMNAATQQSLRQFHYSLSTEHQYVEGIGYLMGDMTCRFNARSAYLRCAVNPGGPCKGCPYYESIEFRD